MVTLLHNVESSANYAIIGIVIPMRLSFIRHYKSKMIIHNIIQTHNNVL